MAKNSNGEKNLCTYTTVVVKKKPKVFRRTAKVEKSLQHSFYSVEIATLNMIINLTLLSRVKQKINALLVNQSTTRAYIPALRASTPALVVD